MSIDLESKRGQKQSCLNKLRFVSLQPHRDNIINCQFLFRLGHTVKLLEDFNLIEQMTERHQPHFTLLPMKQTDTVKYQPGKDFTVCYPAVVFFVGSLSTSRFAPLYIAVIMAFLYSARSYGEVSSSTVSSVRSGFFFSFQRL